MSLRDTFREVGVASDERGPTRLGVEGEEVVLSLGLRHRELLGEHAADRGPDGCSKIVTHRPVVEAEDARRLERFDARLGRDALEAGEEIGERPGEIALETKALRAFEPVGAHGVLAHGPAADERAEARNLPGAQEALATLERAADQQVRELAPSRVVDRGDALQSAATRRAVGLQPHANGTYHGTSCVEVCGARITIHRRGSGRPLLLLHANPGDARDFDPIVPVLARTHEVLAIDWPGYGASPAPTDPSLATASGYATLVEHLVEALGLREADVIGNSVGGNAALHLALREPRRVRRMVLVAPGGFTTRSAITGGFCRLMGISALSSRAAGVLARRYLRERNDTTRAMIRRADELARMPERARVHASIWRSFGDESHDMRERARAVAHPTLLVWGVHDPLLPAATDGERARSVIPGARFVSFDTGHACFAEAPEAFVELTVPFLHEP